MQIVTNVALISINETLLVQLISFLIFLFIINRIMFRPLRRTTAEREDHINQMKSDIDDAEISYQNALAEIKEQELAVKSAAYQLSKAHVDAGSREAEQIFKSAQAEINELKKKAEAEVAVQIAEARKKVQAESEALAVTIMENILGRRLAS